MEKYYYKQHGLLWIVYERVDTGMDVISTEDSRWNTELKASLHCDLLNPKTDTNKEIDEELYLFGIIY